MIFASFRNLQLERDRQTDRQTDRASYRGAMAHLKSNWGRRLHKRLEHGWAKGNRISLVEYRLLRGGGLLYRKILALKIETDLDNKMCNWKLIIIFAICIAIFNIHNKFIVTSVAHFHHEIFFPRRREEGASLPDWAFFWENCIAGILWGTRYFLARWSLYAFT